jgi:glycyl-tRNA synthetase alpha subunit
MNKNAITFSELLLKLQQFWAEQGSTILGRAGMQHCTTV